MNNRSKKINFKLIVSGQHISKKYGNTFNEIESDYGKKNLIKIKYKNFAQYY